MPRDIIIHGHFYQPPREDPWLEEIPAQKGAAPWHDWNEKIERECYRAVAAARVLDSGGKIARVVNAYARISFDIGPTLFEWMELAAPSTYAAILEADRISVARTGHGNAMAQPYHHVILPLASRRDKETEVRWGIADFTRRFGRMPEGMWLPETAVDDETLDVLAQEGIRFTVLAPSQVKRPRADGRPERYVTDTGRSIALCIYDGPRSQGVAFGRLLVNARVWLAEMLDGLDPGTDDVLSVATDGETYGHHHHFSEMALAWLLWELDRTPDVRVTNYASLVARHASANQPPVELVAPSSWSCTHGVDRWRANCGCRIANEHPPRQEWRAPLRQGLDLLRAALDVRFEEEGAALFRDAWSARDAYGSAISSAPEARDAFIDSLLRPGLTESEKVRARELLEMARDGLRMYTSCAWFFDDIGGLEVPQNLRYAARAIELAGDADGALERDLVAVLRRAESADGEVGTGEDVWARRVRPLVSPLVCLAAGAAAASRFVPGWAASGTRAFDIDVTEGDTRVRLTHRRTGRRTHYDVTVVAHGAASVVAYVHPRPDLDANALGARALAGLIPIGLEDFPERERAAVRDALLVPRRRELAHRLLGDELLLEVAHGTMTLADAAVGVLGRQIEGLLGDASPATIASAIDLVDLLDLLGRPIPFDLQTQLARVLERLPRSVRGSIAPLAGRMGFAPEGLDDFGALAPVGDGERG